MKREIIIRAKELHRRGNDKMRIIQILQERYKIDSGTAGSHVQTALDELDAFENAKSYRYWNLFGGIFFLLLAILGLILLEKYMTLYHALALASISLVAIRKGWNQILFYHNELEESKNNFDVYF